MPPRHSTPSTSPTCASRCSMATEMNIRHAIATVLFLAAAAVPGSAQSLRQGLLAADLVVVGRQVGKQAHDAEVVLHRLQVVRTIRGDANTAVIVLDWPNLSLHQRPVPRQQRLY